MKYFQQLISAVALLISVSAAVAQTVETTPNLITNNPQHWSGIGGHSQLGGQHPITLWGCCTSYSGSAPFFDSATWGGNGQSGQLIWSFGQTTVRQIIGINTALSGTGIQISGYNWGYEVRNMNGDNRQSSYSDILTATTFLTNISGTRILSDTRTYTGAQEWNWHGGTVSAGSPIDLANAGHVGVEFASRDAGFWSGYYGPQVRNVSLSLNYTAAPVDPCVSDPQSSPSCPGYKTFYNISDDGHTIVPLPFGFPFYGETFTHSIFFSNGSVSFYSPNHPQRWGGGGFGGVNINNNLSSSFFYTIMPLNTDLINYNGAFYTQGDSSYLRYTWDNISQFGRPTSSNTFSLEIKPTGYIGLNYSNVDIQGPVIRGIVGNAGLGEWQLIDQTSSPTSLSNWSVNETFATDCSNPLVNVNCPGYAQAFFDQQCSINTLYSPACPGYAQAYFDQQCSINTLYDTSCPGYATAYYNYQCSLDALYHTGCAGYAQAYFDQQCGLDPLYNNQCPGYAQAYFDQQCGLDPLYDSACPLYADAFYVQQCTLNPLYDTGCTGYAQAYFDQQCGLDALYDNTCPGYAQAFFDQQCSINSLYDSACPGYAQAYFDQQCSISALYNESCPGYAQAFFDQQCGLDALYDNTCPGYAEAFAKKYILAEPAAIVELEPVVSTTAVREEETKVEVVVEPASAPAVSASPADSATAPVQLVAEPATAAVVAAAPAATETARAEPAAPAARTTRQALAERRMAAAREQAASAARENPGAVTAEMDTADSMEQQAELQNVVLGAMGFVAGFDVYGRATLPDAAGYAPFEIYAGQQNIDTPSARGLLGRSDRLHEEMVNEQYR